MKLYMLLDVLVHYRVQLVEFWVENGENPQPKAPKRKNSQRCACTRALGAHESGSQRQAPSLWRQAPQTGQRSRCSALGCLGAVAWGSVTIVSVYSCTVFTYLSTGTSLALSNHEICKRLVTWVYSIFGLQKVLKICTHRQLILASLIVAILACNTRVAQESLSMMGQ